MFDKDGGGSTDVDELGMQCVHWVKIPIQELQAMVMK